jgi:hypothetical protein
MIIDYRVCSLDKVCPKREEVKRYAMGTQALGVANTHQSKNHKMQEECSCNLQDALHHQRLVHKFRKCCSCVLILD